MGNKNSRIKQILCCPNCQKDLEYLQDKCICKKCKGIYPIINGKFYFRGVVDPKSEITSFLDKIKFRLKKYSKFYSFMNNVISPVLYRNNLIKKIVDKSNIQLNIGSGNSSLSKNIINCDYFPYDNVDIVLDATILPIKKDSVDTIININVLEHIPNPSKVVREIYRVLKKKGEVFSIVPFMHPSHASPGDYQRYTISGVKLLYSQFKDINYGVEGGPISGFLWVLQEILAIIFSFGNVKLHDLLYLFFMVVLFPIKYLDIIFRQFGTAEILASSFYFHGSKEDK